MADAEFLQEQYRTITIVDSDPKQLLDRFSTYTPPGIKSFIQVSQS